MINYEEEYLAHHGVKNQRWGIRRFQNPDGSLTAAGKLRYSVGNGGRFIRNKEYVKTLSDDELRKINNRDAAENMWLKNHPEKKTVGKYIANDLLKPAFEKAMKEQVNNYVSKYVNYSTKKIVDSILNSPDFKEKSKKK